MEYVILGVVLAAIVLVIWGLCLRPARPAILEKMLKREAQADAPEAQYDLTRLHLDGRGPARDTAEGLLRLQRAAGKGHAESQFRMAALHLDPQALYNLGLMYGRGEGTPKDLQESLRCFEKAAQEGHIQAQTILARLSPEG